MSTIFGVKIPNVDELQEIAFQTSGSRIGTIKMYWTGKHGFILGQVLPDDYKVEPMDNSAQGIETIGDIKKAIKESEIS